MKDYEALFVSGVVVSSVIDWAPLSDNIVIGYAALFFQQIAKDKHDYDKEPLLVLKKHPKIDIIFIVPTDYFTDLLKQSTFFAPLYNRHNKPFFSTNKSEVAFQFDMKDIKDSHFAFEFMHERYGNEIYTDEVEHICQSAQTYRAILDEKSQLEKISQKRKSKPTAPVETVNKASIKKI